MSTETISAGSTGKKSALAGNAKLFFMCMLFAYICAIILAPTASGISNDLYNFNFNPKFLMYSTIVTTSTYWVTFLFVAAVYLVFNKFTSKLTAGIVVRRSVIAAFCIFMLGLYGNWYGQCRVSNDREDCTIIDYITLKRR